jgi:hypothetical protein
MASRVRAMWKHSQRVTTAVTMLSTINVLTFVIIMPYTLATATFGPATFPITGCTFVPSFQQYYVTYILCIFFETVVVVFTVIRLSAMIYGHQMRMPLISLLMQDGLVYYIAVVSAHSIVFFTGMFAGPTLTCVVFGSLPGIAVAGVACNRMLLRLQSILLYNEVHVTGIGMTEMDVSARIGPDTVLGTADIDILDSTATSSRVY